MTSVPSTSSGPPSQPEAAGSLSSLAPGLAEELASVLRRVPDKGWALVLLAAWVLLFHFLGNSTFGYIDTPSLFDWLNYSYSKSQDDEMGRYVPFIVLVLLWRNRDDLAAVATRPWLGGAVVVAFALLLHVLGYMIQQTRLSVIGFYLGIYGLVGAVWGWRMMKATFFPFFLFGFCLPVGTMADSLTLPLRMIATTVTAGLSRTVFGIALVQRGTLIFDAEESYRYEVAAACGGLRSLTATLALASIYAFITFRGNGRRLLMIASAFPLAVAGNILRLTTIIVAAEVFGQETGNWVHDNTYFSLLPYVPAFLGLGAIGSWLREPDPIRPAAPSTSDPAARPDSGAPTPATP